MANAPLVLVVDDDANNLELLSRFVTLSGYAVVTADCGSQAIAAVANSRPDLVLLDWMMPDLSGIDVLRTIRQDYDENTLPVIMCTALIESEYVSSALEEGANDYLSKPVDPAVLSARISSQLSRKAAMQSMNAVAEELEATVADRTRKLVQMRSDPLNELHIKSPELLDLLQIVRAVAEGDFSAIRNYQTIAADMLRTLPNPETFERKVHRAN